MRVRKIAALAAAACLVVLLLAGCVHTNVNLRINADGSADYGVDLLMDDSLIGQAAAAGQDVWAQARAGLGDRGFTVTDVKQGGYSGISAVKHYDDVSKIAEDATENGAGGLLGAADAESSFSVTANKGFFGTTYTVKARADVSKVMETSLPGLDAAAAKMLENVKANVVVTLPVKAASHDATEVSGDGLTYTWELRLDQPNAVNLSATVPNLFNIALVGGSALLVLIIVIIVVALVRSAAKKKRARISRRR